MRQARHEMRRAGDGAPPGGTGGEARARILCAAFSARQIAMSAARAGLDALAADFFADQDLAALARRSCLVAGHYPDGFCADALMAALETMAAGETPIGFVYGAGFEDRPELLERIGARWPILGTAPDALRALKDPDRFAAICAKAGVAFPPTRTLRAQEHVGWLSKQVGGAGGSHVRYLEAAEPAGPNAAAYPAGADAGEDATRYFQRFVPGERWSAAILASGGKAFVLGFSRQWCDPSPDEPFRYGGAVGPLAPPAQVDERLRGAVDRLVSACAREGAPVLGLASVDFVVTPEGQPVCLEINPRFGATIDLFDRDEAPLLSLHLDAVGGVLPSGPLAGTATRVRASGLVWAETILDLPASYVWPAYTRDRSRPPLRFLPGMPLATLVAEGTDEEAALANFATCRAELLADLQIHASSTRDAVEIDPFEGRPARAGADAAGHRHARTGT